MADCNTKGTWFTNGNELYGYVSPNTLQEPVTKCREHIMKHWNTTDFEEAFSLFYGRGAIVCPVCIIFSYAWYFESAMIGISRYMTWLPLIKDYQKVIKYI